MTDQSKGLFDARITRRQLLIRGSALAVATPSLASILAACAGSSQGGTTPSGTLTVVMVAEPLSLAADIDQISADTRIWNQLYDALTWYAWDGSKFTLTPVLATSWKQTDPTTWRFNLRQGVKFHNGETFNADAVVFTFGHYLSDNGDASTDFTGYSCKKVDDYTVDVTTPIPNLATAPALMCELNVYPPKYYDQVGTEGFNSAPIGTGPYKLDSWQKGVSIKMSANPNYWGPKPAINKLVFKWVGEPSSRIAELQTGEAGMITDLPPDLAPQVQAMSDKKLYITPGTRRVFLEFNTKKGPTSDVRVRQAVNYAIDRDSIVNGLFAGKAAVLKGTYIPGEMGYDSSFQGYTYDPEKAKSLLADAGLSGGVTIPFHYPLGFYVNDKETCEAIQAQLAKVGIKCQMDGQAKSALNKIFGSNQALGMTFWTYAPIYFDPNYLMDVHFDTQAEYHYNNNPEQDQLIHDALITTDPGAREKKYQDLQKYLIMDHAEWAPILVLDYIVGTTKSLQWSPRPDGLLYLAHAKLS